MKPTLFLPFLSLSLAFSLPSRGRLQSRLPAPADRGPIDVSGQYAFVPPTPEDLRGPCPGLNALANHNYLPHSGLITVADAAVVPNAGLSTTTVHLFRSSLFFISVGFWRRLRGGCDGPVDVRK
jgi:hypothetical protein